MDRDIIDVHKATVWLHQCSSRSRGRCCDVMEMEMEMEMANGDGDGDGALPDALTRIVLREFEYDGLLDAIR